MKILRFFALMFIITLLVNALSAQQAGLEFSSLGFPHESTYDAMLFPHANVAGVLDADVDRLTYVFVSVAGDVVDLNLTKADGDTDISLELHDETGALLKAGADDASGETVSIKGYKIAATGWYYAVVAGGSAGAETAFSLRLTGSTLEALKLIIPADAPLLAKHETILLGSELILEDIDEDAQYLVPVKPASKIRFIYNSSRLDVKVETWRATPLALDELYTLDEAQWLILTLTPLTDNASLTLLNDDLLANLGAVDEPVAAFSTQAPTAAAVIASPTTSPDEDAIQEIFVGDVIRSSATKSIGVKYRFFAEEGEFVSIVLNSEQFDAYLMLFYDGSLIEEDDDSAGINTTDAAIKGFEVPKTGEYVISAEAFGGMEFSGQYTLHLISNAWQFPELTTCPGALPSRLYPDDISQVNPEGSSNRIRSGPGTRFSQVGVMQAGSIFTVLTGPECADGYAWYRVNYEGTVGWTAEGTSSMYWLEDDIVERRTDTYTALLHGGRGLTNGRAMNYGNFQVEGYCQRQGYGTSNDNREWYCTSRGQRVETISEATFTAICQETYSNPDAYALRLGRGIRRAYRWRCVIDLPRGVWAHD